MQILIAEDERITRMSLARQLEHWGHTVVATEDGAQAWEKYQAGGFDIVITDWEMPQVSGVELIQRIRAATGAGYVYLIMLTSRSDKSDIVKGIEAGADDFVSKPFDREELRVRLLAGVRIVNLERTLNKQNAELRDANERIHHGLQAAARVQRSMLPHKNIVTPHVRTAWNYVPSEELAGDAIGLHLLDERYLVAYVIDVSGHGVPAALLSVSAMHAMDPQSGAASLLRDLSGQSGLGTVQRPDRVATGLNQRFRSSDNDGRYLTMILTVLDTHTGQLHFTSAGHPFPLILRGAELIPLAENGAFPIAMMDEAEYENQVVQLTAGDRVILLSDGLLEQSKPGDFASYGEENLLPVLVAQRQMPLEPLGTHVIETLSRWAEVTTFADDVSLVMVEWLG